MRDFNTKIDNTAPNASGILTADEDNVRFREMEYIPLTADMTLDGPTGPDTDLKMLSQAIARYASGGVVGQDTGGANTYIIRSIGSFILPKSYFKGMMMIFYPMAANTGPATINVNAIGTKQIYNSIGGALVAGDIAASTLTMLLYDPTLNSGAGAFKIAPWSMPMRSVGGAVDVYEGMRAGRQKIRSLGAGTNITLALVESPALSGEFKIVISSSGGGGGGTLADGDKGDITVTSSGAVWTIDPDVVDNTKAANMPANTFKARRGSIGDPEDITGSQAAALLPDTASGVKGLPTPDGNATHYLNGIGGWTTPTAAFPTYPNPGSYTCVCSYLSAAAWPGTGAILGQSYTSSFWSNLDLPAGVWQLTGYTAIPNGTAQGGDGGFSYLYMLLRIS